MIDESNIQKDFVFVFGAKGVRPISGTASLAFRIVLWDVDYYEASIA